MTGNFMLILCVTLCRLSGLSPFSGSSDEETLINVAYSRYDAGDLLDGVSNEALKFLYKIMKLLPRSVQLSSRGYLHAQENPYELCACSTPELSFRGFPRVAFKISGF